MEIPELQKFVGEHIFWRHGRDQAFRSREWSPLAVVALAPLQGAKTTIGSGPEADLRLPSEDVAPIHAVIEPDPDASGGPNFRLSAPAGKVWTVTDPPQEIAFLKTLRDFRFRIGRFILYVDNLGTFGPVVRAMDFSSPAYTKFDGLKYYAPDPAYRVRARIRRFETLEKITIVDTHGWQRPAWRYGEASFSLQGKALKLLLLLFTPEPGEKDKFFIAFTDETRGKETHPSMRYLEPPFASSDQLDLDFNWATNPSCAYNLGFACPLPPRENRLPIEIRAGEKIYPYGPEH